MNVCFFLPGNIDRRGLLREVSYAVFRKASFLPHYYTGSSTAAAEQAKLHKKKRAGHRMGVQYGRRGSLSALAKVLTRRPVRAAAPGAPSPSARPARPMAFLPSSVTGNGIKQRQEHEHEHEQTATATGARAGARIT